MNIRRTHLVRAIATSALAVLALTGCSGSSTSESGSADTAATEETQAGTDAGLMGDASTAVPLLLETIWPIEGNDYAETETVTAWCTKYATDKEGAVADVVAYLSSEPDVANSDPESVNVAIDTYLDGNCYLLEE